MCSRKILQVQAAVAKLTWALPISLQNAFNQAITELMLEGIPEETTPKLYSKKNVTPNEIILVQPEL